jgi:DNA-binding response OmpR family regulator
VGEAGRVLIVDDDASVRTMLAEYLGAHGFTVALAADSKGMHEALVRERPDVVLLDLRLGGEDGLSLARYLREHVDPGIIMVTGAGQVVDRIVGLEVGADDYVTKPFDPRELLARIKSVLRRTQSRRDAAAAPPTSPSPSASVSFGTCRLDLRSHQLYGPGESPIPLTSMEFDLLRVFAENPGRALSRDKLLTLTRNREWEPYDRSIDIRVARLRRKIEPDPEHPMLIRTVRGVGYIFTPVGD